MPPRAQHIPEIAMPRITVCLLAFAVLAAADIPARALDGDAKPAKFAAPETNASLGVTYTISFWGIPFGHTDFDSKFHQQTYNTISHFETSGIVSMFWQAKIEANSNGELAPHALEPAVYDSLYQRGAGVQERVKVTFAGNDPAVEADPPYPTAQYPVTPEQKKEALDPLSAVTLVLAGIKADSANPCGTVAPVFDGRRRYNIEFTYLKDEKTTLDGAIRKETAHLCQIRYHQIAGFKPKILKEGKAFPPIYGWFTEIPSPDAPGGRYVVALKVWAATGWGTVDATLTQMRVDGADIEPKS
jgi:hypothetical protein